jgi:tryptophanyl-tRNA synthetase
MKKKEYFLYNYSRKSVLETAASLIACGIDPKRSIIYRQSDVRIPILKILNKFLIQVVSSYSISLVTWDIDHCPKSGSYSNL